MNAAPLAEFLRSALDIYRHNRGLLNKGHMINREGCTIIDERLDGNTTRLLNPCLGCNGQGFDESRITQPSTRTVCVPCFGSGQILTGKAIEIVTALLHFLSPVRKPDATDELIATWNRERAEEHAGRLEADRIEREKRARAERARDLLAEIGERPQLLERIEGLVKSVPPVGTSRK